jgi:2-polyprenyl-3-methyl-5-hydroxy-6-metoxy-1,4-benzoquinol methylase
MIGAPMTPACSIPCNLCGCVDVEEIRSKDRHGRPLRSVICRRCGLVWTDPRLTPDQVRAFYAREYRLEYKGAYEPRLRQRYRNARVALDRLRRNAAVFRPGARVLDVGAGSGEVVYLLRAMGCEASGVEPNEAYARYAAETLGLPVTCGFYQDRAIEPGSLDVVSMFHTVEHLENPAEVMAKAAEWLKPGGALIVEIPNVEAVCQQPHQQFHRGHLYHFNLSALSAMLRRVGFEVVATYTSRDGGNIAATGRRIPGAPVRPPTGFEDPSNYTRVSGILRRHTAARHAISVYPWIRPIRKLWARVDEYRHVSRAGTPRDMLDAFAAQIGDRGSGIGEQGAGKR